MNERIKELALQAGFYVANDKIYTPLSREEITKYQEKFAELIIKECANVCLARRDPANLNYKPSERFAEAVKQHFGVQ